MTDVEWDRFCGVMHGQAKPLGTSGYLISLPRSTLGLTSCGPNVMTPATDTRMNWVSGSTAESIAAAKGLVSAVRGNCELILLAVLEMAERAAARAEHEPAAAVTLATYTSLVALTRHLLAFVAGDKDKAYAKLLDAGFEIESMCQTYCADTGRANHSVPKPHSQTIVRVVQIELAVCMLRTQGVDDEAAIAMIASACNFEASLTSTMKPRYAGKFVNLNDLALLCGPFEPPNGGRRPLRAPPQSDSHRAKSGSGSSTPARRSSRMRSRTRSPVLRTGLRWVAVGSAAHK